MAVSQRMAITTSVSALGTGAVTPVISNALPDIQFKDSLVAGSIAAVGFFGATTARTDMLTNISVGVMDGGAALLGRQLGRALTQVGGVGGGGAQSAPVTRRVTPSPRPSVQANTRSASSNNGGSPLVI